MHYLYHTFIYALLVLFLFKIKNNTLYYILFVITYIYLTTNYPTLLFFMHIYINF